MAKTPPDPLEDLITSAEVCDWAGIDRSTLSRHVAFGKIKPAMRLPTSRGAMLFRRADVAVYIATIKPERVA